MSENLYVAHEKKKSIQNDARSQRQMHMDALANQKRKKQILLKIETHRRFLGKSR